MAGMHNLTYYEVHRYIHSHKQKMLGKDDKNALKKGSLIVVMQYWLTALSILCLDPSDSDDGEKKNNKDEDDGFWFKSFKKASILSLGPGRERPGIENQRFLIKIL